jgi:hypothetical protein
MRTPTTLTAGELSPERHTHSCTHSIDQSTQRGLCQSRPKAVRPNNFLYTTFFYLLYCKTLNTLKGQALGLKKWSRVFFLYPGIIIVR